MKDSIPGMFQKSLKTHELFGLIVEYLESISDTSNMKRSCPTIQELMAFDAVASFESLTRAAGALCVSVGAISKQLAALETFVGKPLFEKRGRGVKLTTIGREYWNKISPSLRAIESATFDVRAAGSGSGVLTLASVPTFLTKWLIPRLGDFRQHHPRVTFSFSRHLERDETQPHDIDASIRYGAGDWPNVVADYIAGREFVCVMAPDRCSDTFRSDPQMLLKHATLLHHAEAPTVWRKWAAHHELDTLQTLSGPRFAQYAAIIQGALSGFGAALVPQVLVEDELRDGRLVAVGNAVDGDQGHYLCFASEKGDRPVFAAFRNWILKQGTIRERSTVRTRGGTDR